jgi:long-chain-fatty-acyl-CoA reductase
MMETLARERSELPPRSETFRRGFPFIVGGRRVDATRHTGTQLAKLRFGEAFLPEFTRGILEALQAQQTERLCSVPVQEILSFFNRMGRLWKNREYTRRRIYIQQLQTFLGYSAKMAEAEADWIASLLRSHVRAWDQLSCELGSRFLLDDWVRQEDCLCRAYPRGLTLHMTAGNVPTSSVVSAMRGLVTKNVVVLKPAADDLITSTAFALSMQDLDKDHPVTKSLSVVYWPHDYELGRELVRSCDAVCAWGGSDALAWAHKFTMPDVPFIPFGPKSSLAVIGANADIQKAAIALAHDTSMYDQRACFSVQRVFVEGFSPVFLKELTAACVRYMELYPAGQRLSDEIAATSLTRRADDFLGATSMRAGDTEITVCPPDTPTLAHPLGRYLYIHPVETLDLVAAYIGRDHQTIAVYPWDMAVRYRDEWTMRGASRIVELGLNNLFRCGSTHDGIYPMASLVRLATMELPASTFGKGMVLAPDLTEFMGRQELADIVQ